MQARRTSLLVLGSGLIVGLGSGLAGCGFKLRGATEFKFTKLFVDFPTTSATGGEFRRTIRSAGNVELVDKPEQADLIMNVLNELREREITGFSSTGRPREYQLRLRFIYALRDAQRNPIGEAAQILLRRDITTTDAQIAAKQQEEVLLYREMQSDLVQQLLRRLAAVDPKAAPR